MRTATPTESWHECGSHRVRVVRRIVKRRRRYLATVYRRADIVGANDLQRPFVAGRTVWGNYATPAEAVQAAQTFISCTRDDDGERVCNWRDVERVRADLRREAANG